jgi:D-alanyl-D-alanine carboxypeptidase
MTRRKRRPARTMAPPLSFGVALLLTAAACTTSGASVRSAPTTTVAPPTAAASPIDRNIQAALDAVVAAGAPGAAATLTTKGSPRTFTAGVAAINSGRPIGLGDHYRIASQTKSLTATIVLQLANEKRLSLSDTVARWMPGLVPNERQITVRQLLNMTSGLHEYFDDAGAPFVLAVQRYPGLRWQPQQLAAIAATAGPDFPPAAKWNYTNTNYELLGLIAEKASHSPLAQLMSSRIFKPLGLRETTYRPDVNTLPSSFVSGYYTYEGSPPVDVTDTSPTITGPAGAIVSTQPEVIRMFSALLSGRLLPAKSLRDMMTPSSQSITANDEYGLGLEVSDECGRNYGHAGTFAGYKSRTDTTSDGKSSYTYVVNTSADVVKQMPPFPAQITPSINQLRSVLRCAIHGQTAPSTSGEPNLP